MLSFNQNYIKKIHAINSNAYFSKTECIPNMEIDTQIELHQQEPAIPSDHSLLRLTAQLVYLYSFDLFQNFYNI